MSKDAIPMSLRFHIELLLKKENLSLKEISTKLKTDKGLVKGALKMLEDDGKVEYTGGRKWKLVTAETAEKKE